MAGIIKKQILKHLSRFTKNLSPDKINLSTLKGEGQLSNLELDEEVLQNMLDLPTWLAVTRVYCNKAAIRIQWTKLKTSPICLFLDKVEVEMRTCEEPRAPNGPSPIAITAGQSEYGFAEKVVEGMSVIINSITIKVQSRAFHASFELWQLQGNSLNPKWQKTDLRYTRITDPKRGEVLTFKEINWQSLRIEADAIESEDQDLSSIPLRLITNQGRIRIALKRRVKDCNVLASKLLFILDDLLWVLTDSQLKAVIHYAKSLSEAMEKSAQQRKNMAAESQQTAPPSPGIHNLWTDPSPPTSVGVPSTLDQYFDQHDVKESSYHTFISRLDLHICNDSSSADPDEPPPPGSQGAMQLTFRKLGFDYYPIHRPADGCQHWERHCGAMEARAQWACRLLQEFQRRVEASGIPGPHSEIPNQAKDSPAKRAHDGQPSPPDRDQSSRRNSIAPLPPGNPLKRLRSSCVVVRLDDLDIHQVSTGGRHSKKTQSLLSCNRKALNLADNIPAIHLQFTEYYFPDNPGLPVPNTNLYTQLNGLQLCLDPASLLWVNLFSRGLLHTLEQVKAFYHLQDGSKAEEHVDIRMDAAQIKLIIPLESSIMDHQDRPQSLNITVPQTVLSNTCHSPHGTRADLNATYSSFSTCHFFQSAPPCSFPRDQSAFLPLPSAFFQHSLEMEPQPFSDMRPLRAKDVWFLSLSRLSVIFEGARKSNKGRAHPFVEPFSTSVWICRPCAFKGCSLVSSPSEPAPVDPNHGSSEQENQLPSNPDHPNQDSKKEAPVASIHFLAQAITPVKVWLNHYQYVALLRMKDTLARLGGELGRDTRDAKQAMGQESEPPTMCLALLMDSVELGLLLPPAAMEPEEEEAHTPGSESLTDSDLSPTHQVTSPGPLEDSGIGNGTATVNSSPPIEQEVDGVVEEASEAVEVMEGETTQEDGPVPSPPFSPEHHPSLLSRDPSTFSLEEELSNALTATKDVTKDAFSASLDLTKGAFSITKDAFSFMSRGAGMSKLFTTQAKEQRPEEGCPMASLRLQSMKLSLSQYSFDSAILDGSLPDDHLSVDSDSSDNLLMDESGVESMMRPYSTLGPMDSGGSAAPGTEGGSSADLSSSLSQSIEDITQDTASVLLLVLSGIACVADLKGEDLVVAVEVQHLTSRQMGNVRVSDLLARQMPGGSTLDQRQRCRSAPVVGMRMEMGPSAARHGPLSALVGHLELGVQGCRAELLASTLATLGPFLEDELSADVQPMKIRLDNVTITLKDDGPKIYPTAPQPQPATFTIDQVVLERSDDGLLRIKGGAGPDSAGGAGPDSAGGAGPDSAGGAGPDSAGGAGPDSAGGAGPDSAGGAGPDSAGGAGPDSAGGAVVCLEEPDSSCSVQPQQSKSPSLGSQLLEAQLALSQALTDRERLLLEVRKYDPMFDL
ncbi:bridge-like lipid transfer protein family member 3A [Salvelinus fontinalis]|uniref:bridge-like lipid transfer protein family member 3A n=1 Tax=Salvelinus fontinalis TaxID=8038 RepID=UPI0024856F3E|nr:bridge-like lipid transfer protein family member 3A [Salvelinus fontinalis]